MGKTETGKNTAISAEQTELPESISLILAHCCAFLAITFIVVGELMHEQNTWAVLVIGGSLGSLNVLLTSIRIEHRSQQFGKTRLELSPRSRNTREVPHRSHVYVGDAISIDMDSLTDEKNDPSHHVKVIDDKNVCQTDFTARKCRTSKSKHMRVRMDKAKHKSGRSSKRLKENDICKQRSESKQERERPKQRRRREIDPAIIDRTERSFRKKKKSKVKKVRISPRHAFVEV